MIWTVTLHNVDGSIVKTYEFDFNTQWRMATRLDILTNEQETGQYVVIGFKNSVGEGACEHTGSLLAEVQDLCRRTRL